MKHIKKYGKCFQCNRLLPLEYLKQIEFYNDHIIDGALHYKLLCVACEKRADEVFEDKNIV